MDKLLAAPARPPGRLMERELRQAAETIGARRPRTVAGRLSGGVKIINFARPVGPTLDCSRNQADLARTRRRRHPDKRRRRPSAKWALGVVAMTGANGFARASDLRREANSGQN